MAEAFNPYHKWLAIPLEEQPPNHYRLLGLTLFESDLDVIETAADQRVGHVRTFQAGKHGAESQNVLNELTAARLCLLSAEKKTAYDQSLKAQLARQQAAAARPAAAATRAAAADKPLRVARAVAPARSAAVHAPRSDALGFDPVAESNATRHRKQPRAARQPFVLVAGGAALLVIVGVVWALTGRGGDRPAQPAPKQIATTNRATSSADRDDDPQPMDHNTAAPREIDPPSVDTPAQDEASSKLASRDKGLHADEDAPSDSTTTGVAPGAGQSRTGRNAVAIGKWIDLIPLADSAAQQLAAAWQRTPDGLRVGKRDVPLTIPMSIEGNYDLHVEFTRLSGRDTVLLILPIGSKQCMLALSGHDGEVSGVGLINGQDMRSNPAGIRPGILENGHRYRLDVTVRQGDGEYTIETKLDGKPYVQSSGKIDSLGLHPTWVIPRRDAMAIAANEPAVYHAVKFKLLAGTARIDKDAGPAIVTTPPAPDGGRTGNATNDLLQGAVLIATFDETTIIRKNGRVRVQDLSGKQKPGLLADGTFAAGKVGLGLSCQKIGDHVDWGDDESLCPPLFSACVWIKPIRHTNELTDILTKHDDQHGNVGFALRLNNDVPQLSLGIGQGNWRHTDGTSKWPLEEWGHLAATSDGSVQNIYVNGRLAGSTQMNGRIALSNSPFFIGSMAGRDERQFFGLIDEVAVFDRAISAAEVWQIYQLGERGKSLAEAARFVKPGKSPTADESPGDIPRDKKVIAAPPLAGKKTRERDSGKLPVPSSGEQKKANDLVRSVHKADIDKAKSDDAKSELASTLLQEARQTRDDPASQYALFMAAADLAAGGNDISTAIEAWQAMAQVFDADLIEGSWQILKKAPKSKNAGELKAALQRFSDDAAQNDRYDLARNAFEALAGMSQAKEAKQFKAEVKRLEKFVEKSREAEAALAELKTNPADAISSRVVGEFLCLYKGDWPLGLPFLSRGDDSALQELAKTELSGLRDSSQRLGLADAWWNFSDKQTEKSVQSAAQLRAVFWYRKALPGISGITKSKVEGRVSQVLVSVTERVLVRKLRGRVTFDSKANEAILLYDWTSKTQLDDFEIGAVTPRLQKGALILEVGQSITHRVDFTKVGIAVPVFLPQMRGMLLKTSGGAYVRVGGDNPDTLYLGDGKSEVAEVVPDIQRKGIQPLGMIVSESELTVKYGQGAKPTMLMKPVSGMRSGQVSLYAGEVGFQYATLVLRGKIDETWIAQMLFEIAPTKAKGTDKWKLQ